jgi:hypothetical protein
MADIAREKLVFGGGQQHNVALPDSPEQLIDLNRNLGVGVGFQYGRLEFFIKLSVFFLESVVEMAFTDFVPDFIKDFSGTILLCRGLEQAAADYKCN